MQRFAVLNEDDKLLALTRAHKIEEQNIKEGRINKKVGDRSSLQNNILGQYGEVGFGKMRNLELLDVGDRRHYDFDTEEWGKIDIKGRWGYQMQDMLLQEYTAKEKKFIAPDTYGLCTVSIESYGMLIYYRGWCTADELIQDKNLREIQGVWTYVRDEVLLHLPLTTLELIS